ncbi:MAG TPA: YWFCY domain-containing protein, partial [Chitinophagaceae bacterium]|nr:YWFCY domain-containing protein [Chitinophagaceae bacterium]
MSVTGENEQGLRKIVDLTRKGSLLLLGLHFYLACYGAFLAWGYTGPLTDRLLWNLSESALFSHPFATKGLALGLLLISLLGAQGRKTEGLRAPRLITGLLLSGTLYLGSAFVLQVPYSLSARALAYMAATVLGYGGVLTYGTRLTRLVRVRLSGDIFNEEAETFPQEERLLQNEYSVNLRARYRLKGAWRRSWVNIINPFRGVLVMGSPGSGKSYFVIEQVLRQHLGKGFALLLYDFKYDDLSRKAYHWLQEFQGVYTVKPSFHLIQFDDLGRSDRCNPLDPATLLDITDAAESARTILLGLNREWISKQGDFFVESPINFVTAVIWFLRKFEGGRFCTLPHAIELMQAPYEELFPVLNTEPEIEVLVNPFVSAYQHDAMEQLEGQVASAKIGMARLVSPQLYWVLSGNNFSLQINDPAAPKVVCLGNTPERQQIYGAVLSLYVARILRQVNRKGGHKCSLIFDEFPTLFVNHIDTVVATARSNRVATVLGVQDFSQLKKDYGRDGAEVILNIAGNVLSGQVVGDTARHLSDRFGKILQERTSLSINRTDVSVSRSRYLDLAVPPS